MVFLLLVFDVVALSLSLSLSDYWMVPTRTFIYLPMFSETYVMFPI